jgi:signal transduction histidine kinase/CheY-like chemotaxis protein
MLGLAGQAAISIDNARLFEAAQRANHSLEQRVEERSRELEAAHEALRQSQKMEAIGQLTGGIAHDFNNLLTVIKGSADLLQRGGLPEAKKSRYIDAISDTADRATKLTGQLLAFARRQALKPELFDVFKTIEGVADMLRTMMGSRVEFTLQNDCGDCFVEADLAQFETALVNLAVNARDAMDGEGTLTITVDKHLSSGETGAVRLRVTDSGAGIAPEEIDRIFEPFYTTKEVGKGTGLGLSQVYGFVKQSDGEVSVESELGRGTTFKLALPLAQAAEAAAQTSDLRSSQTATGGRVLIVEDNRQVGEFACQLLSDLGFDAVLEENAKAALSRLELQAGEFDLIFSDVVMPGMDGVAFGRIVRERWQGLPVVLTSGYSHVLAEDTRHGFPLVHKPYSAEAVSKALREARQAT